MAKTKREELKIHYSKNGRPYCNSRTLYPETTIDKTKVNCCNCMEYIGVKEKERVKIRRSREFYFDINLLLDRCVYGLEAKELATKIKEKHNL